MESEPGQPVCYVTTIGRRSGRRHTIEIWYAELDGSVFLLSGHGDRADWVRNLAADPQAAVSLAPDGPGGARLPARAFVAELGPLPDELPVRQAMDARYHSWTPGRPLSSWATESLVVQLVPSDEAVT